MMVLDRLKAMLCGAVVICLTSVPAQAEENLGRHGQNGEEGAGSSETTQCELARGRHPILRCVPDPEWIIRRSQPYQALIPRGLKPIFPR